MQSSHKYHSTNVYDSVCSLEYITSASKPRKTGPTMHRGADLSIDVMLENALVVTERF